VETAPERISTFAGGGGALEDGHGKALGAIEPKSDGGLKSMRGLMRRSNAVGNRGGSMGPSR